MTTSYDYIIVGSGIAGLYAAILAREHGPVLVLTKGSIDDCNTRWAQGGIAAPIGPGDSAVQHLRDTIAAGAGIVDEEAARVMTSGAAERIRDLVALGVPFDTHEGQISLGMEGAHSVPRIVHAGGDSTGAQIELTLSSVARLEGITVLEWTQAVSLLRDGDWRLESGSRVVGVRAMDVRTGETTDYDARFVVLATGGAGRLYSVSTNPEVATGDGIAIAYRAGAEITDMEFIQFHPTALRLPGVQPFLISEAARGEGGVLVDTSGRRFMPEYDSRAELAPRDIVARAILERMQATGSDHVLLDLTHLEAGHVAARFPQIYQFCLEAGLDITKEPIPVSPAAHYTMGGIRTNVWGETTVKGLYACGECACTGVHGANRLASNSLLETVVFAKRVVERTVASPGTRADLSAATQCVLSEPEPGEAPPLTKRALQELMWRDVGIVRDGEGLRRAKAVLSAWASRHLATSDRESQELSDMLVCARLVTEAALVREESRGAHFRSDFPLQLEEWRRRLVWRGGQTDKTDKPNRPRRTPGGLRVLSVCRFVAWMLVCGGCGKRGWRGFGGWVILSVASRSESNCSGIGLDRDQRATAGNPDERHSECATRAKGLAEPLGDQPFRRRPRTQDARLAGREAFVLQIILWRCSNGRGSPHPPAPLRCGGRGAICFVRRGCLTRDGSRA